MSFRRLNYPRIFGSTVIVVRCANFIFNGCQGLKKAQPFEKQKNTRHRKWHVKSRVNIPYRTSRELRKKGWLSVALQGG